MKQFSSYFKYFSDSDDVINGIFQNNKIRFTQPWGMNDPLEFNPSLIFPSGLGSYQHYDLNGITFPSEELFYRVYLIESQINSYGILSLTKQPFSFDMWSRYANGHKGFLLEFKPDFSKYPCMKSSDGNVYPIKKIKYVDDYSLVIENILDGNTISLEKVKNNILFTKTKRWKGEKEYRFVRNLSDYPNYAPLDNKSHRDSNLYLFDFSLECIKSVVFGACMSNENKRLISEACSKYDIELYQSYIIRNQTNRNNKSLNVNIININKFPDLDEFFNIKSYIFIKDDSNFNQKDSITVNHINELPYYEGNEKIVNEIFNRLLLGKTNK